MKNIWIRENNYLYKETEDKYSVLSYTVWCLNNKKSFYIPLLHSVNKKNYSRETIKEMAKQSFYELNDLTFGESVTLLSSFMGDCTDITDKDKRRVMFPVNQNDSEDIIIEKLFNMTQELNL